MKKRIFIAINLPEEIRSKLVEYQNRCNNAVPARWTKPENLHITLVFIGDTDEQEISKIQQAIQDVIVRQKSFLINLTKICYAPPKITPPRMVWAKGEKSEEFDSLCDKLGEALAGLPKIHFKSEARESIPHITLARIKDWEWRRIEPEERPEIDENIDLLFTVESIEVMESVLKRGSPQYTILESHNLKT